MFSQNKRFVIALSLLIFLSFAAFAPSFSTPFSLKGQEMPIPGTTSNYTEYFNSTSFLDGGTTTADGWGNDTVTSPRSVTAVQLNFTATANPIRSLDVQGRTLFITQYEEITSPAPGVQIFNITDPSNPIFLDDRGVSDFITTGVVDGHIWYIGTADFGSGPWFAAYNVTTPTTIPGPSYSTWLPDGDISDIEVQGHFVYIVCAGASGQDWIVMDVEDPTNIQQVASLGWSNLYGFAVDGHIGYFADGLLGLYVRNISAPAASFAMDSFNTPGNCTDVIVDGSIAYVADGPSGVHVFNVSDPSNLVLLGSYDTGGFARRLALQGKTLIVADGSGGVVVLDVSDPTHPSHVNVFATPYAWDVDLYAGNIVVGTDNGFIIFQYGSIELLNHYASFDPGFDVWDIRVRGHIAYVAAGTDGFITLDVSDPGNPVFLANYSTPGPIFYRKLDVQGHLAFIANFFAPGIVVFDISNPRAPQLISAFGGDEATDICVRGEVVYVAAGSWGLQILNYSNPYTPYSIYSPSPSSTNVTALWVQGHYLYNVRYDFTANDHRVYELTNINAPYLTDQFPSIISEHYDIYVDGYYSYVANGHFFYISDNTNPWSINYGSSPIQNVSGWDCLGTWGFGPYALLASSFGGVQLIDATNPFGPHIIDHYSAATMATQITMYGDYVYVANQDTIEIFRLYRSAGASYVTGTSTATSMAVDSTPEIIYSATLTQTANIPAGTSITWSLSADGGINWEAITPGTPHIFSNQGSDLRYRATFSTNRADLSAHLYNISISYQHSQAPSAPVLEDPGTDLPAGTVTINWSASTDPDGTIDHYVLQSSNTAGFAAILATYTTTNTNYNVTAPTTGTFFFRVCAVDNDGVLGPWSNVEDINITGGLPPPPPIPGFPLEAIIIGAIVALGLGVFYRRRKH
jgi:hypothetical protein